MYLLLFILFIWYILYINMVFVGCTTYHMWHVSLVGMPPSVFVKPIFWPSPVRIRLLAYFDDFHLAIGG